MTDQDQNHQHDQDSEPGSVPAGAAAASDAAQEDADAGPASVPAGAAQPAGSTDAPAAQKEDAKADAETDADG